MSAVLIARVHEYGGDLAVAELLRRAGSTRSPAYRLDIVNWISYEEAVALWQAGAEVTHHPQFARAVGEDAARHLNASPVAALLRSLGSPEAVYSQIAVTSPKYSVVTKLEATSVGPGFAEIVAVPVEGFPRDIDHCAWTCGLMTQPPVLFGLPPAVVEHDECAALGAEKCVYRVRWSTDDRSVAGETSDQLVVLRDQLEAMRERLHSMFATAADLIGADRIDDVIARITDRAAAEVRATRYLLAVRLDAGGRAALPPEGLRPGRVNRNDNAKELTEAARTPTPGGRLEKLLQEPTSEPMFIDAGSGDPLIRQLLEKVGAVASIVVPLATADTFLGLLIASVLDRPQRLAPTGDPLDRLSGVAAQATTALQNGRLVDQITHQASHDELTGLANRSQFTDELRAAIARARQRSEPVTIFYIDLDGFKPVNDRYGHEIGDLLLAAVGERLSAHTRASDVIARLGGDGFAVLIAFPTAIADANAVAERLGDAFAWPFSLEGLDLWLGASVGRASFPVDSDSAEGLLRIADAAMFEAKRSRPYMRGQIAE